MRIEWKPVLGSLINNTVCTRSAGGVVPIDLFYFVVEGECRTGIECVYYAESTDKVSQAV